MLLKLLLIAICSVTAMSEVSATIESPIGASPITDGGVEVYGASSIQAVDGGFLLIRE